MIFKSFTPVSLNEEHAFTFKDDSSVVLIFTKNNVYNFYIVHVYLEVSGGRELLLINKIVSGEDIFKGKFIEKIIFNNAEKIETDSVVQLL